MTVIVVMAGGLWIGGFLQPEELKVLQRIRVSRGRPSATVTPPAETTEFAGEIVTADLPDERVAVSDPPKNESLLPSRNGDANRP